MALESILGGNMTQAAKKNDVDIAKAAYEKLLNPVPTEDHIAKHKLHADAYIEAAQALKGKYATHQDEAAEHLADALLTYRKEAKLPGSDVGEEDRHHIIGQVKNYFNLLERNNVSVDSLIREGKIDELFKHVTNIEKNSDLRGKLEYELGKSLEHGKDPEFYQGIVKTHYDARGLKISKGKVAKLGNRDSILEMMIGDYNDRISSAIEAHTNSGAANGGNYGAATGTHGH